MQSAKDFLLQEAENLKRVLDETLRFKYGIEGSSQFFQECQDRLTFISTELSAAQDSDHDILQNISFLLNQLSGLISRIERASVGEYSWPFVEELKRIAVATCTEPTLTDPNTPPQIHVLSNGGLDAYAIQPEVNRPSGSRRRIHTIIFPRTLKHFVLLHSILGHELGHAMWKCSQHQAALQQIVRQKLFTGGPFANVNETAKWLYSANAPARVKYQLAFYATKGVNQTNFFSAVASWPAWMEEVLCDFIGLLTFGPSFVAAECNLLYSMDPAGTTLGAKHPPTGCRGNYLLSAADIRGYTSSQVSDPSLAQHITVFWDSLRKKQQSDPWFDVFTVQQIQDTTDGLATLLDSMPPALYGQPPEEDLALAIDQLSRAVPPVGFEIGADLNACCREIDFRSILYAGWMVSINPPKISFAQLNRLCEQGMLQQHAINLQVGSS